MLDHRFGSLTNNASNTVEFHYFELTEYKLLAHAKWYYFLDAVTCISVELKTHKCVQRLTSNSTRRCFALCLLPFPMNGVIVWGGISMGHVLRTQQPYSGDMPILDPWQSIAKPLLLPSVLSSCKCVKGLNCCGYLQNTGNRPVIRTRFSLDWTNYRSSSSNDQCRSVLCFCLL